MSWLQRRRERVLRLRYEQGFDYAAGQLLRGVPPETLNDQSDTAFSPDVFDKGIRAATAAFRARKMQSA